MSKRIDELNQMNPGEWRKIEDVWHCKPPSSKRGGVTICPPVGSLTNHDVTEHDDGTITVSPSISIAWYSYALHAQANWHGYLEHGVWREI